MPRDETSEKSRSTTYRPGSVRFDVDGHPGPPIALERLYAEHGALVLAVCRSQLENSSEAEDAAQQVFLSAYTALLRGSEPRSPAAWLATIARRECGKRSRSQGDSPLPLEDRDGPSVDALSEALRRFDRAAVRDAISNLPTSQRRAFVLRELIGLPYAEIARHLAVTEAAVESLLVRARQGLRERLEGSLGSLGALVSPVLGRLLSPLSKTPPFTGSGQLGVGPLAGQVASIAVTVSLLAGGAVIVEPTVAGPDRATRPSERWDAASARGPAVGSPFTENEEQVSGSVPSVAGLLPEPSGLTLEIPLPTTEPTGPGQEQALSEAPASVAAPPSSQNGLTSGGNAYKSAAQAAASEPGEPTPTGPGSTSDDDLELDEEPGEEPDDQSDEGGEDPPEDASAPPQQDEEGAYEEDEAPGEGQQPEEDSAPEGGDSPVPPLEPEPGVTPLDDFAADPGSDESSNEPSDEDVEGASSDT